MIASLKQATSAVIVSTLVSCVALSIIYKAQQARTDLDVQYNRQLQEQTAKFASIQAERQRAGFLEQHKRLFAVSQLEKSIEQLRSEVLAALERMTEGEHLVRASYEFMQPQKLVEVNRNTQILSDTLKFKGVTSNMMKFNQAIDLLEDGALYFYELRGCDITRLVSEVNELEFECMLSWYSLV